MGIVEMFSLSGKKAFVTGAAQGIGQMAALTLAEAGADVAVVDRNQERLKDTVRAIEAVGGRALGINCDVTDPREVDRMIEQILDEFGTVDIAFNNAGICHNEAAEKITFEDWKRVIDINLTGVFLTAQAAGRVMLKNRKGSVIYMASMSGHIVNAPQPQSSYNASKAGVLQLTKSLAVEWAPFGVRVNSLSPGYIGTEMTRAAVQWIPTWEASTPMKRMGMPTELMPALVYLACDASSYTTGSDVVVDGGFTCL